MTRPAARAAGLFLFARHLFFVLIPRSAATRNLLSLARTLPLLLTPTLAQRYRLPPHRHQRPLRRVGMHVWTRHYFLLHKFHEVLYLPLHLFHALAHLQDDGNAGNVYSQLARQ